MDCFCYFTPCVIWVMIHMHTSVAQRCFYSEDSPCDFMGFNSRWASLNLQPLCHHAGRDPALETIVSASTEPWIMGSNKNASEHTQSVISLSLFPKSPSLPTHYPSVQWEYFLEANLKPLLLLFEVNIFIPLYSLWLSLTPPQSRLLQAKVIAIHCCCVASASGQGSFQEQSPERLHKGAEGKGQLSP